MKNKILKISIVTMMLVILMQLVAFAAMGKITLDVKTDKDSYNIGDKVTLTIDWTKEAQAAGCLIKYDKDKLAFDSTSEGINFYNSDTAGEILFNWASFDGSLKTKAVFVLTAKAEGNTEIKVQDGKGFAADIGDEATGYEYKNKTITISKVEQQPEQKPSEGTNTGNNTTTKPNEGTNTGNNTTTKPNEGTNTGGNTATKPSQGTNTGGNTATKPSQGTNTGSNTTTKPSGGTNAGIGSTGGIGAAPNTSTTTNKKDNTTASGKMPQTGAESVVFAIVLVAVVGTIGFVKYRGLSDI